MTQTTPQATEAREDGPAPILEVKDLVKHYPLTGGGVIRRRIGDVHAACGISFPEVSPRTPGSRWKTRGWSTDCGTTRTTTR